MGTVTADLREVIAIAAEGARLTEEAKDTLRESIAKGLEAGTCVCEDAGCDPREHWGLCAHRLAARVRAREWG